MKYLRNYENEYAKFKWQFQRRNKEYKKDWNELKKKYNLSKINAPKAKKEEELWKLLKDFCIFHYQGKEVEAFCKKWGLAIAVDPAYGFNEIYKHLVEKMFKYFDNKISKIVAVTFTEAYLRYIMIPPFLKKPINVKNVHVNNDPVSLPGIRSWSYKDVVEEFYSEGLLRITVSLEFPKKKLMEHFEFLIDEYKNLYELANTDYLKSNMYEYWKREGLLEKEEVDLTDDEIDGLCDEVYRFKKTTYYPKKFHYDNFPLYLKVYDLKKTGMSWSRIVGEMDLNSIQTARNHYRAACRIIEQGVDLYIK